MVKLTMVGRVRDALPLALGARYPTEENGSFSIYTKHGESILNEISRGTLSPSRMTILVDHHCFNFLVENGFCFIALCDSSYPRALAFQYLKDLQKELGNFDNNILETITRPYSFIQFDSIIVNVTKQYIDTRTQANLSKLNANRGQDLLVVSEHIVDILKRQHNADVYETRSSTTQMVSSSIWGCERLQAIAFKWMPITIAAVVAAIFIWATVVLKDPFILPRY